MDTALLIRGVCTLLHARDPLDVMGMAGVAVSDPGDVLAAGVAGLAAAAVVPADEPSVLGNQEPLHGMPPRLPRPGQPRHM